jgi:hypothetical protein
VVKTADSSSCTNLGDCLLSRDLLEPASQLYRDWALNHGQGRDWSRISEQQREALNKSTGFNLLLAAVCAGNGNIASVFTGQPATEENRSPFAFEKDGQRYEWRGLVVGAPAGEQSLDLALVIGTEPVIGWRVGDSVLSGNSALSLVAQIWEDWWKMGQPQSSDYRPVAYPAETTPRMPGYAVKRRFYDLFLPLD